MVRRGAMGIALCLLCLWHAQALGCAFGGETVTTTVFKAFGDEAVRWAQEAEREPPVLLRISHVNSYPVTDIIEVDDPAVIAAYLNEFRTLGVNMNRPEKSPEGAYTTYIFYTRDGRSPTFVFESGKACIGTQWTGFTLYPVVGIEDLEQMDAAHRARQSALQDQRAWAQTPDWFRFWDHTVELRLPENDHIGYNWSQRVESEGQLILIDDSYLPGWPEHGDSDEMPSGGEEPWGEHSYIYRAVGEGEAVIHLTLTGPDGSAVRELSCKVRFTGDGIVALTKVETRVEQWMKLMRQLNDVCWNMDYRDRTGDDSFVYRIGDQRFVSWQDVDALMAVMEARVQLQQWELENKTDEVYLQQVRESITAPDEELAQSLLLGQMFLLAEADARGITEGEIVQLMGRHQRREAWADIVPDGADPADPDVLVRRGLISLRAWLNGLSGPTDSPLPFEGDTDQINALIEQLVNKYPHMEAEAAPTPAPTLPPVIELSREAHRLAAEMAVRDRSCDTPIYQIDEQRFVSREDVEDHLGIMRVGVELKKLAGESALRIVVPTEGYMTDLLVRRLLLQAEADALGLGEDGLEAAYKDYLRGGWQQDRGFDLGDAITKSEGKLDMDELKRQFEAQMNAPSPTPDAPTAETLVLEGWVRVRLRMDDLMSSSTSELPYTHHARMIDDLIEQLKLKHPSTAVDSASD